MLSLRIALRYLLSRKSHGAVNIISAVSPAAIAVAAAAMVIVLSVFNGFTRLAESKLSAIDPDFLMVPVEGKAFGSVDSIAEAVSFVAGVAEAAPEITEQAFAVAGDKQMPVTIKGMTAGAIAHSGIGGIVIDGSNMEGEGSALLSVGVAMGLNLRPSAAVETIAVFEPRRVGRINPANPMAAFRSTQVAGVGVYQVEQEEYDCDMIILPYDEAASLLSYDNEANGIAVWIAPGADAASVASELRGIASHLGLAVKDRHQQQEQAFRMISIEKWITFLMLAFILVIASFNIISTLSMLIIEKEGNMLILSAMGATRRMQSGIFILQGWLIVIIGGLVGIILGTALVLLQQHFGLIKLGAADMSVMSIQVYPVLLKFTDILVTFATIAAVALLISPVVPLIRRSGKRGLAGGV